MKKESSNRTVHSTHNILMYERNKHIEEVYWGRYMSCFPETDNGIPPGCCYKYCPLNHANPITNDNDCVRKISPFGYQYFDVNRKIALGIASMITIMTIFLTLWGCFALSTSRPIVQRTYWAGGTGTNLTTSQEFSMYVGLRSLEYVNCSFVPGYDNYGSNCVRTSYIFGESECSNGPVSTACTACSSAATAMWVTSVMACFSLLLSFLGAQTRMRVISKYDISLFDIFKSVFLLLGDVPVQKMLGMFAEVWGVLTLAYALFTFQYECFAHLHSAFNVADVSTNFWIGPGLWCYALCCASGMVRAIAHWLTPLPGHGASKLCELFSYDYWKEEFRVLREIREKALKERESFSDLPKNSTIELPDKDKDDNFLTP